MSNFNFFNARKSLAALAVGAALTFTTPVVIAADNVNGSLKGVITSETGSELSGVTITVRHQTKGITRTVTSDGDGEYNVRALPVGRYTVSVSREGFTSIKQEDLVISLGQASIFEPVMTPGDVGGVIRITGSAVRRIDTSTSTSGLTISAEDLDVMPVFNGFENIALLAPGVVSSGGTFDDVGGAGSFGGGSGAENGYFLNGMNISELRRGVGSMKLPWEAIAETQIKTGAISSEFGRFIGGVVNAVVKSGENDFRAGGEIVWHPKSTYSHHDSVYNFDGTFEDNTQYDEDEFKEINIWASGAIIEDELFYYGLFNPRRQTEQWANNARLTDREIEGDRWLVNLQWFIGEEHSLNLLSFSNSEDTRRDFNAYDPVDNVVGESTGYELEEGGGEAYSLTYKGQITEDFSVSALAAQITQTGNVIPTSPLPSVIDDRTGSETRYGNSTTSTLTDEEYVRTQFRVDVSYKLDDHSIKFGVDSENLEVSYVERPNGEGEAAGWWTISNDNVIRRRVRTVGGKSELKQFAYYVQDSWHRDDLVINAGVRVNSFENTTTQNLAYSELDNQIAPRLQAIYDLNGDGTTKLFATFGRYFQPIPANMNIKQASGQRDVDTTYAYAAVDANGRPLLLADGSPSRGAQLTTGVTQAGIVDNEAIADNDLEPMYSDEFTVGFETEVFERMSWGARFVHRELKQSIEDSALYDARAAAIARWEKKTKKTATKKPGAWILLNPGRDVHIKYDLDGDGTKEALVLTAEDIALPEAQRKYLALENTLSGFVTDDLYINASYTWSHSYGNTEGLIRTDNAQADPGWTMSNDFPETTDHGYGNLPNDRRHAFKLSGMYKITEDLTLGFVSSVVSGRPYNSFGRHPLNTDSCAKTAVTCRTQTVDWINKDYGNNNFYTDGVPVPRGSAGNLDTVYNLDVSLAYTVDTLGGNLTLKGTIYNLINSDTATDVEEFAELANKSAAPYDNNNDYLQAIQRQKARYLSLQARYEF